MKTLEKKYIKKPVRKTYSTKIKVIANKFVQGLADNCCCGRSDNSCGVYVFDEVNEEFENSLLDEQDYDEHDNTKPREPKLNTIEYQKYKEYLIENFGKLLKQKENYDIKKPWAFYNFSLNEHANKDLIEILDKSTIFQTDWKRNPNSGNKIKVWLI